MLPVWEHPPSCVHRALARVLVTCGAHRQRLRLALKFSREEQILDLLSRGKTNMDIATALDISPFTVKNHLQRIFRKIGVTNRTHAVLKYNEALPILRD